MSAIGGLISELGAAHGGREVHSMMQAMAHRTPDGVWTWSDERASLSYGDLATGGIPKRHLACVGVLTIVADARLDNRDELIAALSIDDQTTSDAALILAAYRRWSEGCAQHLLGDFAFAIWDAERGTLFCGRDHFGVKPFYYCRQNGAFQFASELGPLAARGRHSIDENYIADFLVSIPPDIQSTLYQNVFRLPPAHTLTWQAGTTRLAPYWRLLDATSIEEPCPDPAATLRDLLSKSVRCRLRDANPVGAFLSGGLDSSSIVAIASPLVRARGTQLHSLSMTFDRTPEHSERTHIETMVRTSQCQPHFVSCDDVDIFANGRELICEQEGPFIAPGLAMSRRLYRAAKDLGVRVILDGHGGDEVVSHGFGRLKELAIKRRWRTLWREVAAESGIYGQSSLRIFSAYFLILGPARRVLQPALGLLRRVRAALRSKTSTIERPAFGEHVNPTFAERVGVSARYSAFTAKNRAFRTEREQHLAAVTSSLHPYALEILDKVSAAAGIEVRYPFWDKRLLEFCLSLPAECKLRDGWSRRILRDAMAGLLPDSIRWRRDKFDFGPLLARSMQNAAAPEIDQLFSSDGPISSYLDVEVIEGAMRRLRDRKRTIDGVEAQMIWRSVMLAVWLNDAPPSYPQPATPSEPLDPEALHARAFNA